MILFITDFYSTLLLDSKIGLPSWELINYTSQKHLDLEIIFLKTHFTFIHIEKFEHSVFYKTRGFIPRNPQGLESGIWGEPGL